MYLLTDYNVLLDSKTHDVIGILELGEIITILL